MIHNVYFGLESSYIGLLRNEICTEAVASVGSFWIYTQCTNVYICAYPQVCQNGDTGNDKPSMIFAELHFLSLVSVD